MAFLDNSGDIILDAVLTDTGRMRLAQGDGSFKITKFALGDDEINYGLYDKSHLSGSAYYDLQVLQSPVFEAFTNNTSNLNSKLMSISRTNILYMPMLKLNRRKATHPGGVNQNKNSQFFSRRDSTTAPSWADTKFVIAVDADTHSLLTEAYNGNKGSSLSGQDGNYLIQGVIQGYKPSGLLTGDDGAVVRVDQGLDTTAIDPTVGLDPDLLENQFIIEMDYRLGRLAAPNSKDVVPAVNFIDDDNVASYYIAQGDGNGFVASNPATCVVDGAGDTACSNNNDGSQVFRGPRGSTLQFRIHASTELTYSTYLFEQIGQSETWNSSGNSFAFDTSDDAKRSGNLALVTAASAKTYWIDSTIRVVGANTGFRIDVPVRYVKIQ